MTTPTALLIATAIGALLSLPVQAQDLDETQTAEAMDFAMHDAVFTMYHEIGHLLIGELGLPVLGKETASSPIPFNTKNIAVCAIA